MKGFRLHGILAQLRIRDKMIIMFAAVGVLTLAFLLTLFRFLVRNYNEAFYENTTETLSVLTINIENQLGKIEDLSYMIISDNEIQQELLEYQATESEFRKVVLSQSVGERITKLVSNYPSVLSVNFFDKQGSDIILGRSYRRYPDTGRAELFEYLHQKRGNSVWLDNRDNEVVHARMMLRIERLALDDIGALLISVDMGSLIKGLDRLLDDYTTRLIIVSGEEVIYRDPDDNIDPSLLSIGDEGGYHIQQLNGENTFVSYQKSRSTGWNYISITPMRDLYSNIRMAEVTALGLLGVFIVVIVLVGVQFSFHITNPLMRLTQKIALVETGNLDGLPDESGYKGRDEAIIINQRFDNMLYHINRLIEENYTRQLTIKDTQYKMLQTQINPHFLYNTLDSINWLAKGKDEEEISVMVEALGGLLRESLSTDERSIPVPQELALLQSYLSIQKIRFEERLSFQLRIENHDLSAYRIPRFTLQPLVENCITHGMESEGGVCSIVLTVRGGDGLLELLVEDDGPGVEEGTLEKLGAGIISPRGKGIGLLNIDQRLRIAYEDRYVFTIRQREPRGTVVRIQIPN